MDKIPARKAARKTGQATTKGGSTRTTIGLTRTDRASTERAKEVRRATKEFIGLHREALKELERY